MLCIHDSLAIEVHIVLLVFVLIKLDSMALQLRLEPVLGEVLGVSDQRRHCYCTEDLCRILTPLCFQLFSFKC